LNRITRALTASD